MILDRILPLGAKVRRSFSFSPGERSFVNRYYRKCVDRRLVARHQTGDFFFILSHHLAVSRLQRVVELATTHEVELLTHPEVNVEYEALMSDEFANAISRVRRSVERSAFASALPADALTSDLWHLTTDNGHLTSVLPHLTICICTCGRPAMLERLLREISRQETADVFTFSVVVTDNDSSQSARSVVEALASQIEVPIVYCVEAERNIAAARNAALSHATGDFIVFVDDDEFPAAGWLLNLFRTYKSHQVAGVLGPVKPQFDHEPPEWLIKGGFYQRPTHPTGFVMPWQKCRTGNVLFRHDILDPSEPPFSREFGGGGEDQDFFRRMIERGHRFVWCDEAVIYEVVPPSRWGRGFMIHRALLRGQNTFLHPKQRLRNLLKSFVAVPLYALALPVLVLAGHHYFMKYLVKLADHLGLLLASVGTQSRHRTANVTSRDYGLRTTDNPKSEIRHLKAES